MKKLPSKTELSQLLKDSAFDPRQAGPMAVIVSMDSPDYCEGKAVELILEARQETDPVKHDAKIVQAISLLTLARAQKRERPKKEKKNPSVDNDNFERKV